MTSRTVAVVPARGGSRGLPGKNLRHVGGRTLVERAVAAGLGAQGVDEVVVSSDDEEILAAGERAGATALRRPAELATDEASTVDVVRDVAAERPDAEAFVVLQPTSPLRTPADVEACLRAMARAGCAITVVAQEHPWEWGLRLDEASALTPVTGWEDLRRRRQELALTYRPNGAVYAVTRAWLCERGTLSGPGAAGVPMPAERSVDIDTAADLALAEALATADGPPGTRSAGWLLLGSGGHAASVEAVLVGAGARVVLRSDPSLASDPEAGTFADDAEALAAADALGLPAVVAVGDAAVREALADRARAMGVPLPPVVAASATVAATAELAPGVVVLEHGHVGPFARVGTVTVVNTGAVVEHDARVGAYSHVAPRAAVLGAATVGNGCLIGAGAVVLPGVEVGDRSTVGAGATVTADVPAGATVVGTPARVRGAR
ncbi:cytidylyltransferase domain-containing protein [Motilibacter deserti]|uniref:NTP transferase domain-containing protein n=1 Tax=Motilibacter deserti TaxID=2714956 RepID=A0ABX0GVR4_9ACTN|nr:DapH/DapD/GlmU-related protein [Motilibacter deserti]NHC14603.1 NTP transferase domain-containing protein [Motilibacter deserti]